LRLTDVIAKASLISWQNLWTLANQKLMQFRRRSSAHHGLPMGVLYVWLGSIVAMNLLKNLSPRSSGSVKIWQSYDLKVIWAAYLQIWC
jgi:hypothetical protein